MVTEGRLLIGRVLAELPPDAPDDADADVAAVRRTLAAAAQAAGDTDRPALARLAVLESPEVLAALAEHPLRDLVTVEGPYPLWAARPRALFGSWYEFFQRSAGGNQDRRGQDPCGTFPPAAPRPD